MDAPIRSSRLRASSTTSAEHPRRASSTRAASTPATRTRSPAPTRISSGSRSTLPTCRPPSAGPRAARRRPSGRSGRRRWREADAGSAPDIRCRATRRRSRPPPASSLRPDIVNGAIVHQVSLLRPSGRAGGEMERRRPDPRHVALRRFHGRARSAGAEAPLQLEFLASRRMADGRVAAHRALRLRSLDLRRRCDPRTGRLSGRSRVRRTCRTWTT